MKTNETSASASGFLHDLKASLSAWRKALLLPILTALLAVPAYALRPNTEAWVQAISIGLGLFSVGWLGTQLIWYQRIFEGNALHPKDLVTNTLSFILRYFLLILLMVLSIGILFILYSLIGRLGWKSLESPAGRVGLIVSIVVVYFVATFVFPALAYSTRNVIRAIPIGIRMLVTGWPQNWQYLVVPATFTGARVGIAWLVAPPAQTGLGIIGVLVSLAFTGAIARYYLRSNTTPTDAI